MKGLAGIVLAAGASARLGQPKQLVEYAGTTLVARAANLANKLCPAGVMVVTGAHHDDVADAIAETDASALFNPRWQEGMGASIRQGAGALAPDVTGVLIMLSDQPRVDASDLQRLVTAWQAAPSKVAAACYANTLGVPAIFPAQCIDELKRVRGDRGARQVIDRMMPVTEVAMPNAEFDLDTPESLARLLRSEPGQS